jgi:hypothetical protein
MSLEITCVQNLFLKDSYLLKLLLFSCFRIWFADIHLWIQQTKHLQCRIRDLYSFYFMQHGIFLYTVFPHIVSALEWFPPLNSLRTCMYCYQRSQYIRLNSKKNSFRGKYMRKYGMYI